VQNTDIFNVCGHKTDWLVS